MTDLITGGPRHARHTTALLRGIYLPRSMDAGGSAMTTYGIPLLVLAATNSAALTGLAFALEWIPRLAAFAVTGAMVDRYGATRVFRLASAARATVVLAAALALAQLSGGGPSTTITVMLLAAGTGVLTEFSYIAAETAGGTASRDAGDRAHRVQSVLLGIDQVATLAGPALAGLLLQWAGATAMLIVIAAFSLLASALTTRRHDKKGHTAAPEPVLRGCAPAGRPCGRFLPSAGW